MEAYYRLDQDYALVFCASNDIREILEDNSRYSDYKLFLRLHLRNYDEYIQQGSIALNTLLLYHQSFQYKNEAEKFFKEFENKVERDLWGNR